MPEMPDMVDSVETGETAISTLSFLVAEDHELQRSTLVGTLERLGAKAVHAAADGRGALDILRDPARTVDVVISDLDMPGMDGMEFLRRVGQSGMRVSIILASALERRLIASIETMSEAYGLKLLGIVEKPLTPEKLMPLVRLHRPAQAPPGRPAGPAGPAFMLDEIVAGMRNDEFEPCFQPQVDLHTDRVTGAEALARWRHPLHGIVAPAAFISTLEEGGRIDDLTWIMLRKSAAACVAWHAGGIDAAVSVNISLKSLSDDAIADRITSLVRGEGLDPHLMILEVTESAVSANVGKALENLARLRMKGFGLSIDDYGTGYSSMQQLTRIAFSEIKIDQSFVLNAVKEDSARVILESSLEMARKLDIVSVAEGVETKAHLDLLRRRGGDVAQGYYIGMPMDAATFMGWAHERMKRAAPN